MILASICILFVTIISLFNKKVDATSAFIDGVYPLDTRNELRILIGLYTKMYSKELAFLTFFYLPSESGLSQSVFDAVYGAKQFAIADAIRLIISEKQSKQFFPEIPKSDKEFCKISLGLLEEIRETIYQYSEPIQRGFECEYLTIHVAHKTEFLLLNCTGETSFFEILKNFRKKPTFSYSRLLPIIAIRYFINQVTNGVMSMECAEKRLSMLLFLNSPQRSEFLHGPDRKALFDFLKKFKDQVKERIVETEQKLERIESSADIFKNLDIVRNHGKNLLTKKKLTLQVAEEQGEKLIQYIISNRGKKCIKGFTSLDKLSKNLKIGDKKIDPEGIVRAFINEKNTFLSSSSSSSVIIEEKQNSNESPRLVYHLIKQALEGDLCKIPIDLINCIIYQYYQDNSWKLELLQDVKDWPLDAEMPFQTDALVWIIYFGDSVRNKRYFSYRSCLLIKEAADCPYNETKKFRQRDISITDKSVDSFLVGRKFFILDRCSSTRCFEIFDLSDPNFWNPSLALDDTFSSFYTRISLPDDMHNVSYHLRIHRQKEREHLVILINQGLNEYRNNDDGQNPIVGIYPKFIIIDTSRLDSFNEQPFIQFSADGHYLKYVSDYVPEMRNLSEDQRPSPSRVYRLTKEDEENVF